ncbi:unnamed protein product [marine sediment metagenome]|uniref:Uncharacterized protein n=1 Tax=marine sediment metagenome TaxID=412755 RepID=X0WHG1_9ZZZZ
MTRAPGLEARPDPRIARWQISLGLLAVALSIAFLLDAVFRDPDVPLTRPSSSFQLL